MNTGLYFIRHGRLEGDSEGMLHGANDSVVLSSEGKEQMRDAAVSLKKDGIDTIFASTETRTKESAQIISEALMIAPNFRKDFLGRNWGDWAGREWKEVQSILGEKSIEERYLLVPPGGESWKAFENRILMAVNSILNESEGRRICLISHGSVIRVLLPKIFGLSVEESLSYYPDYGSISTVLYNGASYLSPKLG